MSASVNCSLQCIVAVQEYSSARMVYIYISEMELIDVQVLVIVSVKVSKSPTSALKITSIYTSAAMVLPSSHIFRVDIVPYLMSMVSSIQPIRLRQEAPRVVV